MILDVVVFGLSITSSWGNGHAVTYRSLIRALHQRGHHVTFLERDVAWYRDHRDLESADYCDIELYETLGDVPRRFSSLVARADLVIIGSYVPDGAILADWITSQARGVTAFYDIDTPVTLAGLESGKTSYISPRLIPRFDLYLSFTGGPVLNLIEDLYGARRARALYCAADLEVHTPRERPTEWSLGYLGTYSSDRQPALEQLLLSTARALPQEKFIVAGAQYPSTLQWPHNVSHVEHVPPREHSSFYGAQRFTLNLTRGDMVAVGFSPSVRLFEAAAAGTPIITDEWPGLDSFFEPGREILAVKSTAQVLQMLRELPEERRRNVAAAARQRLVRCHTPQHRAKELEIYYREVTSEERSRDRVEVVA